MENSTNYLKMARQLRSIGKMDIDDEDGFFKRTLTEGKGDVKPNDGSVCIYGLTLLETEDLSEEELGGYKVCDSYETTIGEGDTYIANLFDKVLMSMKAGEGCYVKAKCDREGNQVDAQPKESKCFKFNMFLRSFQRTADLEELEGDEKLERAQHHKNRGTELYKDGKLDFAMERYNKALVCLGGKGESKKLPGELPLQHKTLILQCHLNLAAAELKKENYEKAIKHCMEALEVDKASTKGLYRRGQAYMKMSELRRALDDFQAVVALEPRNKAAKGHIATIEGKLKQEKQMYQKMFSS